MKTLDNKLNDALKRIKIIEDRIKFFEDWEKQLKHIAEVFKK